uniref:Zinc finger ZPR1-type domain-containing protein n=1 Tax=Chromera velia CCMP2878 TaxID=1169474 RepID=A0A0G4IDK8_9ALVE|eukprot:Cvel_13406.t1-p1 / transcript=Cvel_13406.t1 / gene=Cvel_13406 / organism=Chromera_velia_CCMP2878 / gene_product=hypothetical protein / transcript_product=hypothetical protein / location=Cvel_scaffold914:5509-6755(-) / protein_length=263 / sequence_SO=supercontig / SO=protein_coding / is_pseudo=false
MTQVSEFKVDISHQEMSRICDELEKTFNYFAYNDEGPSGCEWIPYHGTLQIMCEELGYEDVAEFEDALKGSFLDFLKILPHVELKEENGKTYIKVKADPPQSEWKSKTQCYTITSTKDLWRVVHKSKNCTIEIPELEFEVGADGKRHVDSVYNHIASAVWNLGSHVRENTASLGHETSVKIMETVYKLNMLLDVPQPWHFIIRDPSGVSEIHPVDEKVEEGDEKIAAKTFKEWIIADTADADKRAQAEAGAEGAGEEKSAGQS